MAIDFHDGVFLWILYSKENGSILRVSTRNPEVLGKLQAPHGYEWNTFITAKRVLKNIFKYSVTKTGLEKTINRYLVVR